jgi:hypothetical protein
LPSPDGADALPPPPRKITKDEAAKRLIKLVGKAGNGRKIDINEVEMLLGAGADPNVQDANGTTLLHRTVEVGDLRVVGLLLARGANPNLTDKGGLTPLDWAKKMGDMELINILRLNGGKTKEELEAEEKKKKRPRTFGRGRQSKVPNLASGTVSESSSDSEAVGPKLGRPGSDRIGKSPIPGRPQASGKGLKAKRQNRQTRSSMPMPEESTGQEKIILSISPPWGIAALGELLRRIFGVFGGKGKVFIPHRSFSGDKYYPEKVSPPRQQLGPEALARARFPVLPVSEKVAMK